MAQTVLVTGATGFLGSHLVQALVAHNYRVVILKRSFSNCDRLRSVLPSLISYDLDQQNVGDIGQAVGAINAVIHTATCYGRQGESIATLAEANTAFPLSLVEAVCQTGEPLFINTDTSLSRTLNAYALSKAQFCDWGDYWAQARPEFSFVNLRLEHMVGPGDDTTKFVPYVIDQCLRPVQTLDLTLGEQQRDFIHIEDVVKAYMLLLKLRLSQPQPGFITYDVGSSEGITIRALVEQVKVLTRSPTQLNFGAVPYRPQEAMYSVADIAPLQQLGWQPQYTASQAIEKAVVTTLQKYPARGKIDRTRHY